MKAFDSVPREALFAVLRRYGMPDHFVKAAMETLEWPEGVSKPEFMTREYGKTTGERASRVRDASQDLRQGRAGAHPAFL